MTERLPLFQHSEGFSEEMAQADSITLGGLTMGGDIDLGHNYLVNVETPINPEDAANKAYVDALASGLDVHDAVRVKTPEGLGTQAVIEGSGGSGSVTLTTETMDVRMDNDSGWTTITFSSPADMAAVAAAINTQYGATIATVDGNDIDLTSLIYGAHSQVETQNVDAAITTQVGIADDGDTSGTGFTAVGSGIGKTLEAPTDATAENTIDGVLLEVNDRVLVASEGGDETVEDVDNGLYTVTTLGDGAGAKFKMTRATDCDEADSGEFHQGTYVFVGFGTAGAHTGWTCNTDVVTVDTTANKWTQFSGATGYTFDQGLDVDVSSVHIELDTDADAATAGGGGGSSGLEFDADTAAGQLRVRVSPTGGIDRLSDGIGLDLDGTTLQLDNGGAGSGVSVKGVPAQFEIGGSAVAATVDQAALDTLTAGVASNADGEHTHDFASSGHGHTHAETTGQTVDDHHNQAHAVDGADHTATGLTTGHVLTATGATTFAFQASAEASAAERIENTMTTATDATAVADPVYVNGDETIGKARADDNTKSRVIGINRLGSGAAPQDLEIVASGLCEGVLTGATPGVPYYLGSTGGISTSAPGGGNRVVLIGYAASDTALFVRITDYGKKAS